MAKNKNTKFLLGLFNKLTLLLGLVVLATGCASTKKNEPKEVKFLVINEKDLEEQYKLSENYMKAFVTLFNTGDYKELLKYLPNVPPRNIRAMHTMMKRDFAKLGKIKDVKFAVRLKRHLMADFYWKLSFKFKIDNKEAVMEYLYKIVIVKDKDGKNQIVKADFIFK